MKAWVMNTLAVCFFVGMAGVPFLGVEIGRYREGNSTVIDWSLVQSYGTEAMSWINTGDNLLTVLGMLAGFVMSGGLWQWRKAKAFQRGFDKGRQAIPFQLFTNTEDYKQKYDALLDEHSKRIQELIELKQEMEEWKVDLQKERDAVNAKVVNIHHEYQKEAKQKEEKYLSSCEAIKKQGVDEGMREVAAQIVRHFLNCREVCYGLDSTTGTVRLWADSDKKYMLTHALVSSLIDLSGMRKPSEGNTVPFGRKLELDIGEKWQTTGTANKVDCYIQSFDKEVYDKLTKQEEPKEHKPCVWCLDTKQERYGGNRNWCISCGKTTDEQRTFLRICGDNWNYAYAALDMPLREFIKKYPNTGPASGGKWEMDNGSPDNKYYTQTVREYIKVNGMMRKA